MLVRKEAHLFTAQKYDKGAKEGVSRNFRAVFNVDTTFKLKRHIKTHIFFHESNKKLLFFFFVSKKCCIFATETNSSELSSSIKYKIKYEVLR